MRRVSHTVSLLIETDKQHSVTEPSSSSWPGPGRILPTGEGPKRSDEPLSRLLDTRSSLKRPRPRVEMSEQRELSSPRRRGLLYVSLYCATRIRLRCSDDDSLQRERRMSRVPLLTEPRSPSESPGPGSPSLPRPGSMEVKRPRVPLPMEPRSPRGRRRQGSPDSLNSNSPESSPRYVPLLDLPPNQTNE